MTIEIIKAGPDDAGSVAELIGTAFADLPPTEWLVPVEEDRARVLSANFRIVVDLAVAHGEVHMTADRVAAAVWLPRTGPLPEPEDYDERLAAACGRWTDRFRTLDTLFEQNHPEEPHHHLAFLATRSDKRSQGIGSSLLSYYHAYLDQHGVPAYLEASDPRSRDLYLRHGYELLGEPFTLPSGAAFWPMWRPAKAGGAGN
ncbi:MAG TPA: GNAT family N-acetyltransferase [Jiangellaceae bacterium]